MKNFLLSGLVISFLLLSCSVTQTQAIEAVKQGKISTIKSWIGNDAQKANLKDSSGYSLLDMSILAGQNASVVTLLDLGADPESLTPSGHSALLLALSQKKADCAIALIEKGADIKAINKKDGNKSALHYAAINGLLDCAKLLVEKGHPVDAFDNIKATPLNWASWVGTLEMVRFLVSKGGNPYAVDNYGDAPFDSALENPDKAVREYLLTLPGQQTKTD